MLHHTDIMRKQAQSFFPQGGSGGPSLSDLLQAIRTDRGLTPNERDQLFQEIRGLVSGASEQTPLSALMYRGLGGILGGVIAEYFGMGAMGQLMSAAAGFGVGSALYSKLNQPPGLQGFRSLG